jgi:hypothetical protein
MQTQRLDTASVFERIFSLYRGQARVLLPVALLVSLVPAALSLGGSVSAQALALAANVIAVVAYQGVVVLAVEDMEDGRRDFTIGGLLRAVGPVLGPLMWTALLIGLGVFAGLLAFIVPGLVLATWWSVAAPVVVLEQPTPPRALGRSRRLVQGNGWGVFGVLVVVLLVALVVDAVCIGIAQAISGADVSLALGSLVGGVLTAPLFALTSAVLYLALRGPRPSSPDDYVPTST